MQPGGKIKKGREEFPALTGIRGVLALMVFFQHLPLILSPHFLIGLQLSFHTTLTVFCVLSGFLITYRYADKIEVRRKWLAEYFIKRFARIYPVYFLVLTVVVFIQQNFDPVYLLQNYTLTHNLFFIFPSHGLAIEPSWSLTVEECFYLFAPAILLFSRKNGLFIPVVITVCLLILLVYKYYGNKDGIFYVFYTTFFGRFAEFYSGVYLAFRLRKQPPLPTARRGTHYTAAGVALFALLTLPLIYVSNKPGLVRPAMVIADLYILPFITAVLFWGLIKEKTWLARLLSGRVVLLLGKSSFAFYLIHLPLIHYLGTPWLAPVFGREHHNLYVLALLAICLMLAILVYFLYEEPMNKLISRKARRAREIAAIKTGVISQKPG